MRGYYRQRSKAGHTMTRPAMRSEPDISAHQRFYAEGGYCAPTSVERATGGSLKVSKASVSYGPGHGKTRCRNCKHYEGGSCDIVRGSIDPAYWCNRFDYWPQKMRDGDKLTFAQGGSVADDLNLYQSQYYAGGGSVDDDMLAYMSQYYAQGGQVDPNAGASGIGVYDMSVDGPTGFAGGGNVAIKFIKGLLGKASPAERQAIENVVRHSEATGNEAFVYGLPGEGAISPTIPGRSTSVTPPGHYYDFSGAHPQETIFTTHTHPAGLPLPSPGDLNLWGLNSTLETPSPHSMWIKSTRNPEDMGLGLIEPHQNAWALADESSKLYDRASGRSPYMKKSVLEHLRNVAGSSVPEEDPSRFLTSLDLGWYANQLAKKGLPLNIESSTRLSPSSPVTVEEAWPELIKYYDRIGYSPYAEGGSVEDHDFAGGGLVKWLQRLAEPIKAWHGTPHTFDKFDASHIGKGEGNQVYGHGLYFAENPSVAKYYRESLAGPPEPWQMLYNDVPIYGRGVDRPPEISDALLRGASELYARLSPDKDPSDPKILHRLNQDLQATLNNAVQARREGQPFWSQKLNEIDKAPQQWNSWDDYHNEMTQDALSLLQHPLFKAVPGRTPGSLYEVNLHADPMDFLRWDRPLSDQSSPVQQGVQSVIEKAMADAVNGPFSMHGNVTGAWSTEQAAPERAMDLTGAAINQMLGKVYGTRQADELRDVGIPGIRYLDQNSRSRWDHPSATHNYVVFPGAEDIVEIVNRYFLGGSVGDDE